MILLFAPWTWCSSDAESWVLTMMAYCVQGFRGRMRYPGSILYLSPSEGRRGGSTSAITQLLEPQASCPSNSVTFWKGLLKGEKQQTAKLLHVDKNCISVKILSLTAWDNYVIFSINWKSHYSQLYNNLNQFTAFN